MSQNDSPLARDVQGLKEKGLTAATAESCTGGLVAKKITDLAGVSEVFVGGVVSYANSVKEKILGVSAETLEKYGAVSEETAKEMCEGVRRATGADVGVSTTGIAGPTGGSAEKPVGTVCFGISTAGQTLTYTKHFGENLSREEIREAAAEFALDLIASACGDQSVV